jgi:hypothetical protein
VLVRQHPFESAAAALAAGVLVGQSKEVRELVLTQVTELARRTMAEATPAAS